MESEGGMRMDYIIIGGDARFGWLARLLRRRGETVGTTFREAVEGVPALDAAALARAKRAIVNIPPRLAGSDLSLDELLALMPEDATVYACGPGHPHEDGRVVDLWSDEAMILENAALTAEGALAAAMKASDTALRDMRCMVIGWGRIGRALTELLVGLGAKATVASRSETGRNRAVERGAEAVPTGEVTAALPGHRLIFNTAPGMVLDADALRCADGDAMIVDLASPPYGVDLFAAWDLGLRAWREPALPGRYCPRSAARALLNAIDRSERGGEFND